MLAPLHPSQIRMTDTTTMTIACATCPHRARTQPLALLPEQRVDVPTGAGLLAKARAGRVAALAEKAARRAAAFQPVETILIDPPRPGRGLRRWLRDVWSPLAQPPALSLSRRARLPRTLAVPRL